MAAALWLKNSLHMWTEKGTTLFKKKNPSYHLSSLPLNNTWRKAVDVQNVEQPVSLMSFPS